MSDPVKMTTDQRKALLKEIAVAIALCDSPARKADVALETVEKFYDLQKKG